MKLVIAAILALVCGVAIGAICTRVELGDDHLPTPLSQRDGSSRPIAVVVNGDHFDFGRMERNAKSSHEFILRNDGQVPLTLVTGDTTCKCTLFESGSGTLGAGETTKVKLEWTAKTGDDRFSQSAELKTNDPDRRVIRLVIEGEIFQAIKSDRRELNFGSVPASESTIGSFRVLAYQGDTLELVSHEFLKEHAKDKLKLESRPLTKEDLASTPDATAGFEVRITLESGLPLGPLSQTIRLTTSRSEHPPLELPILGDVVSDISLTGAKVDARRNILNLGVVPRGVASKHTVLILVKGPYRSDVTMKVESVDPSSSLKATLGEPSHDNPKIVRIPLVIEIPADAVPVSRVSSGGFGIVRLSTTHPDTPELKVYVNFAINE